MDKEITHRLLKTGSDNDNMDKETTHRLLKTGSDNDNMDKKFQTVASISSVSLAKYLIRFLRVRRL